MERNSVVSALILSSRPMGEDNRCVSIFSPELGVFDAIQYGGRKSRLRSVVQSFHSGKMWLYTDASKTFPKITDFDVTSYRPSIRESLEKNWAASLCCELILKTHCAGDFQKGWYITSGFLDGLDFSDESECRTALLRFLWRFLSLLGLQANTSECIRCGSPLTTIGFYISTEGSFVCPNCFNNSIEQTQKIFSLSGEALRYLEAVSERTPKESRTLPISAKATKELEDTLFYLIEKAAEARLKTIEAGRGIFI